MLFNNKHLPHHSSTECNKQTDIVFPSFDDIRGTEVFVSLKKPVPSNPSKKQLTGKNALQIVKNKQELQKNERKTIESTIKQLLIGKQQLANYLESQKQFIQVLDVHDQQLRHRPQNRGKLSSSLTQKKKSRIDAYTSAKNSIQPHFSKVSRSNTRILIAKSDTLTMGVSNKQGDSLEPCSRAVIQKRQYQTVCFNELHSDENSNQQDCGKKNSGTQQKQKKLQKCNQKYQVSYKQNYLPGQQCYVMTSPKRKQLRLNQKIGLENHSFYATKYGLTHFSPWAFPKNQYETELSQNPSVFQIKKINQDDVFREKQMNCQDKTTRNQTKIDLKKVQYDVKQNIKHQVGNTQEQGLKDKISDDWKGKQNTQKQTINCMPQRKQNCAVQHRYLSLLTQKDEQIGLNDQPNVNIVKSSQVMILQSETVNSPEIFASKQQAKQMFYPRRSIKVQPNKLERNSVSIETRVLPTQSNRDSVLNDYSLPKLSGYNDCFQKTVNNEQNELCQMKKTEQFLKEIILTKNSVSYANSRSISKKEFKQINQPNYEEKESKCSNVFITKNMLQHKKFQHKSLQKKEVIAADKQYQLNSDEGVLKKTVIIERKKDDMSEGHQVNKSNEKRGERDIKKKARMPLENASSEKRLEKQKQREGTKCLTEASLTGFYMINESKTRNTCNSFVRRKRHSMMVKKKTQQERRSNGQSNQRRLSLSSDKQFANGNIYETALEESKGFGVVNPLTKQLYKKYVSIVQNKR